MRTYYISIIYADGYREEGTSCTRPRQKIESFLSKKWEDGEITSYMIETEKEHNERMRMEEEARLDL